jgi:hypothetical protein
MGRKAREWRYSTEAAVCGARRNGSLAPELDDDEQSGRQTRRCRDSSNAVTADAETIWQQAR